MGKATKTNIPADKLQAYERLVATLAEVERKGANVPYTSVNGHMFSYLDADGTLALRLPKPMLDEFLAKHDAKLMEAYGIVQKEYAAVPETVLLDTTALAPYFAASFAYVSGLKPKPTKRGS